MNVLIPMLASLWVLSTLQLYVAFSVVEYDCLGKLQARTANDNYIQNCNYWTRYGITYEGNMDKIIAYLIDLQSDRVKKVDVTDTSEIIVDTG